MNSPSATSSRMEKIVSLCKRRGFIFQSSEIYGGLNGCWDYGPLGVELKRNLKDYWWRVMTQERDDIVGMDGSILMNRKVWQASGHEGTFSDPMVDCRETKARYRADQVLFTTVQADSTSLGYISTLATESSEDDARKRAEKLWRKNGAKGEMTLGPLRPVTAASAEELTQIPSPASDVPGTLTAPRQFNLMFKTYVGATEDESAIAYLRPETAQAIFVQFRNILETSRKKLPFGIAQIGKAFRNEINPRNFTFRSREFEQMELEYFCKPDQGMALLDYWLEERLKFYENIGLKRSQLHVLTVPDDERAHYSKGTYDIEFEFPFGIQELEGVAYRTDYDLSRHQEVSGKPLEYFDEETKEKFIPHVVEPSAGVDRTVLALICSAYDEETVSEGGKEEVRTVLHFHPRMAPIKVGVFPLLKNRPELVAAAKAITDQLRPHMRVFYDEAGAIGRRYRRQDEAGTPFCITVDFATLGEEGQDTALRDTVTLRHRDSMQQERIPIVQLTTWLLERIR